MSITVSRFKTKVASKLGGSTINKLQDFHETLREAAGNVLARVDAYESKRSSRIANAIFSHIYNYVAPSDLKGNNKIIDIRPLSERDNLDELTGRIGKEFDIRKDLDTTVIEVLNGVKTLRLSKIVNDQISLHQMDSLTAGGTVTASGGATDLTTNELEYVSGSSAIQFNLDASGQGIITIALDTTHDLSDIEDISTLFHWLNFPDASDLTNVKLRWGNDSSNYWEIINTAPHDRSAFEDAVYSLLRADWVNATETGTPDSTAVDWIQIVINYVGAQTNVYLDNITIAKGRAYEIVYYSDRPFKDSSGNWLALTTADTDTIIFDQHLENALLCEFMLIVGQELKGQKLGVNFSYFTKKLEGRSGDENEAGLYHSYAKQYPSEAIETQTNYYDFAELS